MASMKCIFASFIQKIKQVYIYHTQVTMNSHMFFERPGFAELIIGTIFVFPRIMLDF